MILHFKNKIVFWLLVFLLINLQVVWAQEVYISEEHALNITFCNIRKHLGRAGGTCPHAASAGEAGRGFAVVADEVQRLAENAREATKEIATLVTNIQVETGDTVVAMNDVITQVANGTELASKAENAMQWNS